MTALASRPVSAPPSRALWRVCAPALAAALAAAGVAVTYHLFVRTSLGQAVDTAALRGADVDHARAVEIMSRTLNGTTLVSLVLVCLAVAAIGLIRRRIDLAVGAATLVIGANVTTRLLKIRLDRPELDGFPAPNSVPSGHTTAAASVAFALVLVLPHAIRCVVSLIGAAYVMVIAGATVWASWHRPSDTMAAMFVALAWGAFVVTVLRIARLRRPGTVERPHRLSTLLFLATGAVATAAALVGLAAVALSERVSPDLVSGRFAFLTGAAGSTAVVAVTFLIWTRLSTGDQPVVADEADDTAGVTR